MAHVTSPLNLLALAKDDGERYIFLFDDASTEELQHALGRFASDPELSFNWYDAAVLSKDCRELMSREPR
jgi:hypothetical protein